MADPLVDAAQEARATAEVAVAEIVEATEVLEEEFQIRVRKLEIPVKPRGVLAE